MHSEEKHLVPWLELISHFFISIVILDLGHFSNLVYSVAVSVKA